MNKKISAAVATAALVLGAQSAANAGIIIPAGEWTLDVNGNVNVYANFTSNDDTNTITGGMTGVQDGNGESDGQSINTGLLPAWLGFTGTTRQNDLDVSFTISMQPNVSQNDLMGDTADGGTAVGADGAGNDGIAWRQAFLTFGDASWGTVKMGKDIGIFAKNAILSDMTLLGVGSPVGAERSGANFTSGGIGTGYIYPGWKGQISYTSPNMNGLQATAGLTNPNQGVGGTFNQDRFGIEAEVAYTFDAGKIWVSGASYDVTTANAVADYDAEAIDIGVNFNMGNLGLTAYYYTADGAGTTFYHTLGATAAGAERESDGGYLQATYVIPSGTKLGASFGTSKLDLATGETNAALVDENKRWTVGAYHPLTKHLNLVAEFNHNETESHGGAENESDHFALGAILFF